MPVTMKVVVRVIVMRVAMSRATVGFYHLAGEPVNMVVVMLISRQMPGPALAEQGDIAWVDFDIRRMTGTTDVVVKTNHPIRRRHHHM